MANNVADNQDGLSNLVVHNIYIKDVSFEAPNSPKIFTKEWRPKLDFDLGMAHSKLEDGIYEVTLNVTVSVKILKEGQKEDDKDAEVAFLVEVKQAGVFALDGKAEGIELEAILSTVAPSVLFPYAREVVSNFVTKGGFPQLVLPPMNFDAMYQNHLEQQQKDSMQ